MKSDFTKEVEADLQKDSMLKEFMELLTELDKTQRYIVYYALKTGNVKDAEEGLKLYAEHKKHTA